MPDEGETLDALGVVQGTAEDKVVAWDGVHVKAQNKDKVVGVGRGTRRSPRHYNIICEDFVDAKRGCNFFNWESMVKIFMS